jgi:ATP-dependent RNA helicase DDX52/ROK1
MEEDAGRLRGIANVMRAAGCEVPNWMLSLKKERHHSKRKAPEADGLVTEPAANGGEQRQQRKGGKRQGGAAGGKRQGKGGRMSQQQQRPVKKAKGGES